jgi:4-hydroxy-tetrahydrodipicolinate reductase
MGKEIEAIALERGHRVVLTIDKDSTGQMTTENLKKADVAIEFSIPETAYDNYLKCFDAGVPVVSGTTGWLDKLPEVKSICESGKGGFFYASNFSLGVNLFFELNKKLASMMNQFDDYSASMTEIHHTKKLDAPSGTAITLAEGVLANLDRKEKWVLGKASHSTELSIEAIREGEVPGTHWTTYDSEIDTITIKHEAKNRKGFALGAVIAAEFMCGKTGFYGMQDMLKF